MFYNNKKQKNRNAYISNIIKYCNNSINSLV